jgi:hypothetical protein
MSRPVAHGSRSDAPRQAFAPRLSLLLAWRGVADDAGCWRWCLVKTVQPVQAPCMRFDPTLVSKTLFLCFACAACSDGDDDAAGELATPWQGKTYTLAISDRSWTEPTPAIGPEFGPYVPEFWLRIDKSSGTSHTATLGTGHAGVQETCQPTATIQGTGTYPNVTFGPVSVPFFLKNDLDSPETDDDRIVNTTIDRLTFENVLPEGDGPATDGTFAATLRLHDAYPLFTQLGPITDATPLCNLLMQNYNEMCEACPSGGTATCMTMKATFVGAKRQDVTLEAVDAASRNASCNDTQ